MPTLSEIAASANTVSNRAATFNILLKRMLLGKNPSYPSSIGLPPFPNVPDITAETVAPLTLLISELIQTAASTESERQTLLSLQSRNQLHASLQKLDSALIEVLNNMNANAGDDPESAVASVEQFTIRYVNGQAYETTSALKSIATALEEMRIRLPELFAISITSVQEGHTPLYGAIAAYLEGQSQLAQTVDRAVLLTKELEQARSRYQKLASDLDTSSQTAQSHLAATESARSQVESARAASEAAKTQIDQVLAQAETLKQAINAEQARLDNFATSVDSREKTIKASEEQLRVLIENLNAEGGRIKNLNTQSEKLLTSATASALGEAFAREAKNRQVTVAVSAVIVIIALAAMAAIFILIARSVGDVTLLSINDLPRVLIKLAALIPPGIIAKIAAKHLAINRLMREEYAHKASLSTALEGFRSIVDGDDRRNLIVDTMKGLQVNPALRLDPSSNEADPIAALKDIVRPGSKQNEQ